MRKTLIKSQGSRLRKRSPFIRCLKILGSILFYTLFLVVLASFILSKIGPSWQIKYIGSEMRTVLTGSMTGTLDQGTTIVSTRVKPENLRVGDIITFVTSESDVTSSEEKIITHRIIRVESYTNVITGDLRFAFKTKGDANPQEDRFFVDQDQVISRYLFSIPLSSFINQNLIPFLKEPLGIFLLVVSGISIIAFIVVFRVIRKGKLEDDEEDEEKDEIAPSIKLTKDHLIDDEELDNDREEFSSRDPNEEGDEDQDE